MQEQLISALTKKLVGFAGLCAAIECHRKGHKVLVLDAVKEMKPLGDVISFGANGGRIFMRWPGVEEKLDAVCHFADRLTLNTYRGEFLTEQLWDEDTAQFGKKFNGHRGQMHTIIYHHALELGIRIRLGCNVKEYFEADNEAGVVVNDERLSADVVIAADGVRSTARKIVLGFEDKPKPSGYAVWRAWFSSEELAKDPLVKDLMSGEDRLWGWLGPDIHFLMAAKNDTKELSWVCTHKVG